MNEYVEYIKHIINKGIDLWAVRNSCNANYLNVFKVTPSKNDLVCTVWTNGKQILSEYDEKYALADWKTRTRRYYSISKLMADIKRVINIKELKGDNKMEELKVDGFTLNTYLIPALRSEGIRFQFADSVDKPMKILVIHKNIDICVVEVIQELQTEYSYKVTWAHIDDAICFSSKYKTFIEIIDNIKKSIKSIENNKTQYNEYHGGFTTWRNEYQKERDKFDIKDVIFNNPATIVLWEDGTKTVVKAENEEFDPEKGLAMAIAKKALGNNYDYYDIFKKYVGRYEKKQKKGDK